MSDDDRATTPEHGHSTREHGHSPEHGHVFVVSGDLGSLACDDALVPTDEALNVTPGFRPFVGHSALENVGDSTRVRRDAVEEVAADICLLRNRGTETARRWLVNTDTPDVGRLCEAVQTFVLAAHRHAGGRPYRYGRAKQLLALPLVGTGEGGAAGQRGEVIAALLPLLGTLTQSMDVDVALVLADPRDASAAQEVRRRLASAWPLDDDVLATADHLAERAVHGELALFVGAGVSRAAGLPMWHELLDSLAAAAGLGAGELAHLDELAPPDAAALLHRRLGESRFAAEIVQLFDRSEHALAHALLAALPVSTAVTTNWDRLLESAYRGAGRAVRVLPHERAAVHDATGNAGGPISEEGPADHHVSVELVKLHGDVGFPADIVLTRESYLRLTEEQAALTGVVQGLLLTRHMLFVGFSLLDDTFIRIAHQARRVLHRGAGETTGTAQVGTVLALRDDPVRRELWDPDLDFVSVAGTDVALPEAARRLEVFLDRVAAAATPRCGWLLDSRYAGLRTSADEHLVRALRALTGAGTVPMSDSVGWPVIERLLQTHLGAAHAHDDA